MKKTMFLCVFIMMGLFALAACGEGGETSKESEISTVSQVSEAADESGTLSEPSEADDSSVAAVESSEEPSETPVEESSEPSEEVSEVKPVVKEPDYTIESCVSKDLYIISRVKKGEKGEKDEIRYGLLSQTEDDSYTILPPEYIHIYNTEDDFDSHNTGIIVAIKDYDGGEVAVFNEEGECECIGNYFSTPNEMAYDRYSIYSHYPWSNHGVFMKGDGNYIIIDRGGRTLFDDITELVMPNAVIGKYLYFETSDGKCYIAEINHDFYYGGDVSSHYYSHDLRFFEVENLAEYNKVNYPLVQEAAERFINALAEKDDETLKECMTEKLYRAFKLGNETAFKMLYGAPRGTVGITPDIPEVDKCIGFRFIMNWVNPLPGSESLMNYPACMPMFQIWATKGEDGVWRISDLRYEFEV